MNLFFEESGDFKVGAMLSQAGEAYQVELPTGKRSKVGLDIPSGPNSPVGVIWNGLSVPGIGLHGTSNPETIGRARSHGCIRLANWDAVRCCPRLWFSL